MTLKAREALRIQGIGIDIIPVNRITRLIERSDRQTLNFLFTPSEIDFCQLSKNPDQSYTICFATKEAVGKALGIGLVGIDWNEIEANITHEKLLVRLSGKASIQAKKLGIKNWLATWSAWDQHVLVHVLAVSITRCKGEFDDKYFGTAT
ncbi:MAG: 4'-phosphopantetheinyl transferase superfamily protein [Nodularia sp. (in: Bacteria)]|nr:MAG: 4'-phosphopantetheinyl transferase superfamily protein [Nodularia sp. (in: cyanobacteria)]